VYRIERIGNKHVTDWTDMMLELWEDNSHEILKAEHVNLVNDERFGNFICYEDNDEAAGFINMSLRSDYVEGAETSPVGYVEGIYVKSEHRRTGVGRSLLERGAQWARQKGCTQIGADCSIDNALSQGFLSGAGFREAERVVCYIMDC